MKSSTLIIFVVMLHGWAKLAPCSCNANPLDDSSSGELTDSLTGNDSAETNNNNITSRTIRAVTETPALQIAWDDIVDGHNVIVKILAEIVKQVIPSSLLNIDGLSWNSYDKIEDVIQSVLNETETLLSDVPFAIAHPEDALMDVMASLRQSLQHEIMNFTITAAVYIFKVVLPWIHSDLIPVLKKVLGPNSNLTVFLNAFDTVYSVLQILGYLT